MESLTRIIAVSSRIYLAWLLIGCSSPEVENAAPDEGQADGGVADADDGGSSDQLQETCPAGSDKATPGLCGCDQTDEDTDGDGTPDCDDACPEDSTKLAPGVCGCGVSDKQDSDTDGSPDCLDECDSDPNKNKAGSCGCGVEESDDCIDECPDDDNKGAPGICGCGEPDENLDGDAAYDCNDDCPENPDLTEYGACGCSTDDADGDGTLDCLDLCKQDAGKSEPGMCGCGVPDTDTDGDGWADCNDGCPYDSEKFQSAPEICDGKSNDCDDDIDEGVCVPCTLTGYDDVVHVFEHDSGTCVETGKYMHCSEGSWEVTDDDSCVGSDCEFVTSTGGTAAVDLNESVCVPNAGMWTCGLHVVGETAHLDLLFDYSTCDGKTYDCSAYGAESGQSACFGGNEWACIQDDVWVKVGPCLENKWAGSTECPIAAGYPANTGVCVGGTAQVCETWLDDEGVLQAAWVPFFKGTDCSTLF